MLISTLTWLILVSTNGYSSISLYMLPPKKPLDFDSPKSLMQSVSEGQRERKTVGERTTYEDVGHTLVEISCQNEKRDILASDFTGITDKDDFEENQKIYQDGVGFGLMFEGVEGKFIDAEEAYRIFIDVSKTETIYGLRVDVPDVTCLSVKGWLQSVKKSNQLVFALNDDPSKDTQLGCAGLGVRMLQKAGATVPSAWHKSLLVPMALIGGKTTDTRISPEALVDKPEIKRWARADEPHKPLSFYDPQVIADWVKEKRKDKKFKETEFTEWLQKHFKIKAVQLPLSDLQANAVSNQKVGSKTSP